MSGRYGVQDMTAIVCRGTGTWGPRMRLFKRSELLRITVRAKN
jgi:predicted MPP superfamily phosphohydrolase